MWPRMLLTYSIGRIYYYVIPWILSMSVYNLRLIEITDHGLLEFIGSEMRSNMNHAFKESSLQSQSKIILIYTALFGEHEWPNLKMAEGDILLKKHGCPVTNCFLKYNTGEIDFGNAKVVVFHDRDMPDGFELKSLSDSVRPKDQIWVYFTGENPLHSHHDLKYLDDIFNWTMTYKHDSDIWLPYCRYSITRNKKTQRRTNYAKNKKNLIAWLASNCGLMRERVVTELHQLLPVHVGGRCSAYYPDRLECSSIDDCDKKISDFKFYLSFENQLCDEYVTEKYWYRAIKNNVVPIVIGGSSYKDPRVAIPGSFINVLDFKNIDMLAKYLRYLDNNHTAYNEYFKWKEKYSLWEPICDWPFEPYWACKMCMRLNMGTKRKKIKISKYWSPSSNCIGHERNLQVFLENSGHNFQEFYSEQRAAENPYNGISRELDYEETTQGRNDAVEATSEDIEDENEKTLVPKFSGSYQQGATSPRQSLN